MPNNNKTVEFGDRVKDIVSGLTGIAVGYTKWMNGCVRWAIQPEVTKKDGNLPECQSIDESQVEVIKKGVASRRMKDRSVEKEESPGGPYPTPKQF